jgi:membrane-associated phospholipid phosphatase
MMRALSSLGDAALLLPASVILLVYLAAARQFAAVAIWCLALAACAVMTIAAKLVFHACGASLSEFDLLSPSGHASLGTVFYGSLAILVGAGRPRWQRIALAGATLLLLALIGVSRVVTGAHSPEEVVLGLAIGGLCVVLFGLLHRGHELPHVSPMPLALGFLAALALLGGRHFTLEPVIGKVARRLSAALEVCTDVPTRLTRSRDFGVASVWREPTDR